MKAPTLGAWFRNRVVASEDDAEQLSFWSLVEAFVLKGLREEHRLSLQRIRAAVKELRRQYPDVEYPLAQLDPRQLAMRGILKLYFSRVEKDERGAMRLYPFTRAILKDAPRLVSIDPRIAFGRPVIAGTSIPTAVLHERWKAGDSITALAEDYDRSVDEIEEALRFEAA